MTTPPAPTDAQLQQMGIIRVDTMLPPSPSMILAGSRALSNAVLKNKGSNVTIEDIFAAMVLEGMSEFHRLGATVGAGPVTRQRRGGDKTAAEPALLAQTSHPSTHGMHCDCTYCKAARKRPSVALTPTADGSGATVQVDDANAPELIAASAGLLSPAASERKVLDCTAPIYPACDCASPCGYCKWRLQQKKQTTEAPAALAKQCQSTRPECSDPEYDCSYCEKGGESSKGATVPPKPPGIQQSNPGHFESLRAYLQKKLPRTQKKEGTQ